MSDGHGRIDDACEKAIDRGCYVAVPKDNELFIDIDSEAQLEVFEKCFKVFEGARGEGDPNRPWPTVTRVTRTRSPSAEPGHWHIVVTLKEAISEIERVLYQSLLGSDPTREILTWRRVVNQEIHPCLFFENDDPLRVLAFKTVFEIGDVHDVGFEEKIARTMDLVKSWDR